MELAKSRGHITFRDGFEYYIATDRVNGDRIIKAPIDNALTIHGWRGGRFESTVEHAKRYPAVYGFLNLK